MPELPEVEVLVRHLRPLLSNQTIRAVRVNRQRVLASTSPRLLTQTLRGATFKEVRRRGKFLLFELARPSAARSPRLSSQTGPAGKAIEPNSSTPSASVLLVGHLGMTGRMYLLPARAALPKHAAVVLNLGEQKFVFEDTRYFGKFTLDVTGLNKLGPEPLGADFTTDYFEKALKRSAQPIKIKLLDQAVVAGIGNIYASEALFEARIFPRLPARKLSSEQVRRLWHAIREVLTRAIEGGSTVSLDYAGNGTRDGIFYFGSRAEAPNSYEERLLVYDRAGNPCPTCGKPIKRLVQAARSTYYCPACQSVSAKTKATGR